MEIFKIGIGVTVHNRNEIAAKQIEKIKKYAPDGSVVYIVDDGSRVPFQGADFRFSTSQGIAKAKNKCIDFLYKMGCEYFFLFDDDTRPMGYLWERPYIESGENHLMYIFPRWGDGTEIDNCNLIYEAGGLRAFNKPRGCMLFFRRVCFDIVGGFDEKFTKWGYEHNDLSDRIYYAGLSSFRYGDVSEPQIFSLDESTKNAYSTVTGVERKKMIEKNRSYYLSKQRVPEFIPFHKSDTPVFVTCYFANVIDPQRESVFTQDIEAVRVLVESARRAGCETIIFTNCFTNETHRDLLGGGVYFISIGMPAHVNVYFYRWFLYRKLISNFPKKSLVVCVDATDVEVLKKPDNLTTLFCGDEAQIINNPWLWSNHNNPGMAKFIKANGNDVLLNAGVLGGYCEQVVYFIGYLIDRYSEAPKGNVTDMLAFNMAAYDYGRKLIATGEKYTTVFKGFQYNDKRAWIRHK